jgi:hypothetical protein
MSEIKELKIGDRVKVIRQIGKDGDPKEVTGTIERLNSTIRIGGEKTATVKYDDGHPSYAHRISQINPI